MIEQYGSVEEFVRNANGIVGCYREGTSVHIVGATKKDVFPSIQGGLEALCTQERQKIAVGDTLNLHGHIKTTDTDIVPFTFEIRYVEEPSAEVTLYSPRLEDEVKAIVLGGAQNIFLRHSVLVDPLERYDQDKVLDTMYAVVEAMSCGKEIPAVELRAFEYVPPQKTLRTLEVLRTLGTVLEEVKPVVEDYV